MKYPRLSTRVRIYRQIDLQLWPNQGSKSMRFGAVRNNSRLRIGQLRLINREGREQVGSIWEVFSGSCLRRPERCCHQHLCLIR